MDEQGRRRIVIDQDDVEAILFLKQRLEETAVGEATVQFVDPSKRPLYDKEQAALRQVEGLLNRIRAERT